MLLTELILSKRGPLAKVWLSAHHERKLSKQQALGVDVEESVDAILTQEDGPITLRLSGQLMLGVTRIYSRKVQYLLDDCKETRERITLAFRPGIVDLPEDQIRASRNAITLPDAPDFDFFDWSWAAPPADYAPRGLHTAPAAQINLRPARGEYGAYNFGRPAAPSIYGGSTSSRHPSHDVDTSSHLDSQDFSSIDLNLRLEDFAPGDDSIEVAREAQPGLSREGSVRSDFRKRTGSLDVPEGMDVGFEPMDLGLDFGELDQPLPNLEERSRRESSALSTPPPLSPPDITDMTPRTAARVVNLQNQRDAGAKPKRPRLIQADDELELADDDFAAPNRDNSDILGVERYIPADPEIVRLREIVADPGAYFLPSARVGGTTMIYAGPPGLAPELADLFAFPSNILRRDRSTSEERAPKRPRVEAPAEEEDDVELGRRGSMRPASEGFPDPFGAGNDTFDLGGDMTLQDDPQLVEDVTPRAKRVREPSLAPSRAESIARAIQFGEEEAGAHPLAVFDSRQQRAEGESQVSITPSKSIVSESISKTSSGYSRNTGMAMGLLRRELEAIEDEDKVLQFEKIADKGTRRAASAFFFELLVLGTRDCVKLDQPTAYGDIAIRGKEKLFEEISA